MKWWTVSHLSLHVTYPFLDNVISLFYLQNDGAAWGILSGKMWLFYIITVIVVLLLLYMLHTDGKSNRWLATGLSLIIAGALGNFIDRIRLGYVVDMFQLDFIDFPIFNIADMSLTFGVIILLIYIVFIERRA